MKSDRCRSGKQTCGESLQFLFQIASSPLSAAGQFALRDESLFPVDDVEALARRIDWWVDHPDELSKWGEIYAEHTKEHYSVAASVRKFVAMEREAIADNANKQINA